MHKRPNQPETGSEADPLILLQHQFTYSDAGNRWTMVYDDNVNTTVYYSNNSMNEVLLIAGTRGTKIDVTATFDDDNPDRVEIVASHMDGAQILLDSRSLEDFQACTSRRPGLQGGQYERPRMCGMM